MRAGKLDRVVAIEAYVILGQDEYGQEIFGWDSLGDHRAELIQASTSEVFAAGGVTSDVTTVFRTRFLDEVTSQARIVYRGQNYNVIEIKEIGRRKGLEFRAAAGESS